MASRSSSRRRSRRRASSSSKSQWPIVIGSLAVLLVVGLIVNTYLAREMLEEQLPDLIRQNSSPQPHVPRTELQMGSAKRGKAPDRPAPTLTQEMLQEAAARIQEAKELNNEGVTLRNKGDNRGARDKQSQAKDKIDAAVAVLDAPAAWQEEADLEGWAMPAEYVTLSNLFGQIAKLQKRIRMSGGQ